jgi:hypothetical protein
VTGPVPAAPYRPRLRCGRQGTRLRATRPKGKVNKFKLVFSILLFVALFVLGMRLSQNKMLWNDELYSQVNSIEKLSYAEILQGKITEGNNSPLFYILQKVVCNVTGYKLPFVWKGEWGIAEPNGQVILRLLPNFFMSLAAVAIFYVFAVEYSLLAGIYACWVALTTEMCWAYWAEARPYALWYCLTMFQALYFLRLILSRSPVLNKTDRANNWRGLGVVNCLLSLTAVFGAVQAFIVAMVLFGFYERKLSRYVWLLFVPLFFGFFYFLSAPHYVFGLPPHAGSLIFQNITDERLILIVLCGVFAVLYRKQSTAVILRFGVMAVLMLVAAMAIMVCMRCTAQQGWQPFVVSSRYFIFLAPIGAVTVVVFTLEALIMLGQKRWVTVGIVAVLLFGSILMIKKNYPQLATFFSENPLIVNLQDQQQKVKNKAMMVTINHYRPDMAPWKDFLVDGKSLDKRFLDDSVQYYEIINGYVPGIAEPNYMLGLCHSLSGDVPLALAAYEKAALIEPRFFWSWYNVGILYYQQGEFTKSVQAFRKALTIAPQDTVNIMGASKIYEEVIRGIGPAQEIIGSHLQQGYRSAAQMLEAGIRRSRGQPAGISEGEIRTKLF